MKIEAVDLIMIMFMSGGLLLIGSFAFYVVLDAIKNYKKKD